MDFLFKNNTNGTGIELLKNFYISLVLILESGQGWILAGMAANILTVGTDIALLSPITSIPY